MAHLALLFAALVWGVTFVVVDQALEDMPVFHLLAYRFALGALLLAPMAWRRMRREGANEGSAVGAVDWRPLLRDGTLVGVLLFAGYALQTYGLLWTTPSRSAFLTGVSVLLVPAFGWFAGTVRPRPATVLGALAAAAGMWAMFQPWGGDAGGPAFNLGDALTLGCAAAFAAHVLLVERTVRRHPVVGLATVQFMVVAALSAPALLFEPPTARHFSQQAVVAVVVTGVFATALAFACQLYAQKRLGAVETSVLLTLEPVAAAAFSLSLGRESLTAGLAVGGCLIFAGMLATSLTTPPPEPPGAASPRS